MSTLTLYTNAMSRGNTVELLLKLLDVPYQRIELAYGAEMRSPAYLALNPMGKVPTLTDGELVISETAAICLYLADKFFEKGFAPALSSPERAAYYRWFAFVAGPLEGGLVAHELGLELNEEQQRMAGFGTFQRVMSCLEIELEKVTTYLCGSTLTAVDVYVGYFLIFLTKINLVNGYPAISSYINTLTSSPDFKAAMADND